MSNTGWIYSNFRLSQLLSEFDLTGKWQCDYVYWNGRLLAKLVKGLAPGIDPDPDPIGTDAVTPSGASIDGSEPPPNQPIILPYYYHLDHLETPWYITDKNRTVVWRGEYYPYGELYYQQLNTTNPHRLPGQIHDQTTGLYYNWHRYYAPKLGRYYQADPIGLEGGLNQYVYANGNPLRFSDPYGLYSLEEFGYDLANFWIGVGDAASMGATAWVRKRSWYGGDCFTNKESEWYKLGALGGDVAAAVLPVPIGKTGLLSRYLQLHRHHMIPRQFEAQALKAGINIHDFIKVIPAWKHNLKPFGIHTGRNNFNAAWKLFFKQTETLSPTELMSIVV